MSDYTVHNLLKDTGKAVIDYPSYGFVYNTTEPLVVGKTYTISMYVDKIEMTPLEDSLNGRTNVTVVDGSGWWVIGTLYGDVPGVQTLTFTYQPKPDHVDPSKIHIFNTPNFKPGQTRSMSLHDMMLVEGDTPAAWAPAEGETLAGGGALMSANLWEASTASIRPDADGVYTAGKYGTVALKSAISGTTALAENQTIHMGASLRGANGKLKPYVKYRDAAGHYNSVGYQDFVPADEWARLEQSCVVPSGMTIVEVGFNNKYATGDIEVLNPTFSYGSPVCLASSAHTPYATQDHVSVTYATKASLKVTDDSIKAEVEERGKLAGRVGTLESTSDTHTSKLEQLATSIKSLVKGESTYTDPDGKSATSGIYSLITQTRDSATVADVAWTDLWKDTSGKYVRWACRNNVVYVKWKIQQATTSQWQAGTLPAGYRPSEGTVTVAAWTEGNRMAMGWVDTSGGVCFQVNSAQTDGTNQGSLSYPIF